MITFAAATLYAASQASHTVSARFTDEDITVDGYLDEEAWLSATPVTGFLQLEPSAGSEPVNKTEVRILFGSNGIYIGAIMHDLPGNVEKTIGRRDTYNNADWFIVTLDAYYNRHTAFSFGVNAAGVQLDGHLKNPIRDNGSIISGLDLSWNAIWYSATRITDHGWTAEISIPYSMLRFSNKNDQVWGIHFTRRAARTGEVTEWPLIHLADRSNFVAGFARVENISSIANTRNIRLQPYLLSGLITSENPAMQGHTTYSGNFSAGGDFKIGFGPNITLDATINPDFGQVEADPAVLNLTAFETRLNENRPFFMEGADIFQFGIGRSQLYHSRRIGTSQPILGAAKLSGRTAGRTSFGFLGAMEGTNFEPGARYGVARAIQQLGNYSTAGAILTSHRSSEGAISGWKSVTGGFNWDIRNRNNQYGFEGIAAFADRKAINHEHPGETGFMGGLVFRKRQGNINGHITFLVFSDQYNPNDLGWTTFERNFRNSWVNITYNINQGKSFGPFQRAYLTYYHTQRLSYKGWINIGDINRLTSDWITRDFRSVRIAGRFSDMFGGYDLFETRGLEMWARPYSIELTGEYSSDERKNWKVGHAGTYTIIENGAGIVGYKIDGRVDLSSRFTFTGDIDLKMERNVVAWVSNESFVRSDEGWSVGVSNRPPGATATDEFEGFNDNGNLDRITAGIEPYSEDTFYLSVFGERDTRSADLTIRGSMGITSRISLQLYNQMFIAAGRYRDFRILETPDHLSPFDAYPKKNEFSLTSMQLNLVIRWEYHYGSTLYLIWSHGRKYSDSLNPLSTVDRSPYETPFHRQAGNVFSIFPKNVIMLKLDYAFLP